MSLFWMNVRKVLPYKNLEVKDLAFRAGVPYSTIINGMNKNSMPRADLALRISRILNMSIESLLGEDAPVTAEPAGMNQKELESQEILAYRKNKLIIDALENIPAAVCDSIKDLILKTRDSY